MANLPNHSVSVMVCQNAASTQTPARTSESHRQEHTPALPNPIRRGLTLAMTLLHFALDSRRRCYHSEVWTHHWRVLCVPIRDLTLCVCVAAVCSAVLLCTAEHWQMALTWHQLSG